MERDAVRFATYAGTAGISKVAAGVTYADGNAWLQGIVDAVNKMDEDEVSQENRMLYITPTGYNAIMAVDSYKSKEILNGFTKVVKVPQSRFYTLIDLADGTTGGETAGGYSKADGGKDINFMIIQKDAVIQYPKHTVNKVVSPEENQTSDGWMFFFRAYGLNDVYENKVAGIYLSHKA